LEGQLGLSYVLVQARQYSLSPSTGRHLFPLFHADCVRARSPAVEIIVLEVSPVFSDSCPAQSTDRMLVPLALPTFQRRARGVPDSGRKLGGDLKCVRQKRSVAAETYQRCAAFSPDTANSSPGCIVKTEKQTISKGLLLKETYPLLLSVHARN
jgi:hypothetical protein